MQRLFLLLCMTFLLSSCASIFSRNKYKVKIDSEPPGAIFSITDKVGELVCRETTPAIITLPAKHRGAFSGKAQYQISMSKEGFRDTIIPIYFHVDAWFYFNVINPYMLVGFLTDPLTGGMYTIDNRYYKIILNEKKFVDDEMQSDGANRIIPQKIE